MDFKVLCGVDGTEFSISDTDIRLAAMRRADTGGMLLVSCPHCAAVYILDSSVPTDPNKILQWIATLPPEDGNWLACIPYVGVGAVEPLGGGIEMPPGSGRIFYKPGDGETPGYPDGYPRWVYMFLKGMDPVFAWDLMKGKGQGGKEKPKPFYIGIGAGRSIRDKDKDKEEHIAD